MDKLYASAIDVYHRAGRVAVLREAPDDLTPVDYPTTFYGRGRGIHGITSLSGYLLKEMLPAAIPFQTNIRNAGFRRLIFHL